MKKKFLTTLLVAMTCLSLVACGGKDDVKEPVDNTEVSTEVDTETDVPSTENDTEVGVGDVVEDIVTTVDAKIVEVFEKVRTTLGDDYVPSMEVPAEILEGTYGLTPDMYESAYGQMPMMSAHIDFLIGVKANEGQVEAVATALTNYVTTLQNDTMQYPSNLAKLPAAEVVTVGDYVFAIGTFGGLNEPIETPEEDMLAYAKNTVATTKGIIEEVLAQ